MKLVYEKTVEGEAINLGLRQDGYILKQGEFEVVDTHSILDPESLSTQAFKDARDWQILRDKRDLLLASSDKTRMSDTSLTAAKVAEWGVYRQALKDLPQNTTDPLNPIWPVSP